VTLGDKKLKKNHRDKTLQLVTTNNILIKEEIIPLHFGAVMLQPTSFYEKAQP